MFQSRDPDWGIYKLCCRYHPDFPAISCFVVRDLPSHPREMHYAHLGINRAGHFGTSRRQTEASDDAGREDIVKLQNKLHVRN